MPSVHALGSTSMMEVCDTYTQIYIGEATSTSFILHQHDMCKSVYNSVYQQEDDALK
jgi:hypothetical protein